MLEIRSTPEFDAWQSKIKDTRAKARVAIRIKRASLGNFGDHRSVGGRVSELKIDVGKGYRVYYTVRDSKIVLLLWGGTKARQADDIALAKKIARREP